MNEQEERFYMWGSRSARLWMLCEILSRLRGEEDAVDPTVEAAHLRKELEETRHALRLVCDDFGDNDWGDDVYLPDVIERHLANYLHERAKEER